MNGRREPLSPGTVLTQTVRGEKKPSVEGGGRVDKRKGRSAADQRQPWRSHFANCLQRGVKFFSLFNYQALSCQPRMGTNNKYIEVGKQMHRDQPPPKKRSKLQKPGDHCTHTNVSISQSGRRGLETQQKILNFVVFFFFQAPACKVRRLHAKLEVQEGCGRRGCEWRGRGV